MAFILQIEFLSIKFIPIMELIYFLIYWVINVIFYRYYWPVEQEININDQSSQSKIPY